MPSATSSPSPTARPGIDPTLGATTPDPYSVSYQPITAPVPQRHLDENVVNILLTGSDNPLSDPTYRTDVMIIVSINKKTNTATLLVSVNTNQFLNVVSIETLGDGNKRITFAGIPMFPYLVQAATNLDMPIYWEILATNQAGSNGLWQYTDLSATNYLQRYYRSRQP